MNKLITALWLVSCLAASTAVAQPYTPNEAGVTNGHWHLNSADVEANKKIFLAMGGVPGAPGPTQRIVFPGVMVILNQAAGTPPATGGTVGSVVNHVGFNVPDVPAAFEKWKAAGVPVVPGNNGPHQGWVITADGLKIEIQEDPKQTVPIRSSHVHFFLPENQIAEGQAWYAKFFGAKPAAPRGKMQLSDVPGAQVRWTIADSVQAPTKGRILDHIGYDVNDLKAFLAKLEAAGVKIDEPYRKNDAGVGIAFITDPWGARIELNERPKAVYLP